MLIISLKELQNIYLYDLNYQILFQYTAQGKTIKIIEWYFGQHQTIVRQNYNSINFRKYII